ncbi:MAG: type 4a pilus biogenesis protein PilO [Candidatus Omnitrophota bacterium]
MPKQQLSQEFDQISIISIIIVIIGILFGGYIIYTNRIAEIQNLRNAQEKERLRNHVGKLQEAYDRCQQNLPEVKETAWLLGRVAKIANENRIKLEAIKPKPMLREKDYLKFSIELDIKCTYHELGSFISRLESHKKFIRVDKLAVNVIKEKPSEADEKKDTSPLADVLLEVSTFVFNRLKVTL